MKNVLIYTTVGATGKTVVTQASTWSALQSDLSENGVIYDNMKAVVGETRVTLESPHAQLPDGDFTLFLMQKKSKAGLTDLEIDSMEYRECRTTIRDIIAAANTKEELAKRKAAFSDGTKNYTQTKVPVMKMNLKKWFKSLFNDDITGKVVEEQVEEVEEQVEEGEKVNPISSELPAAVTLKEMANNLTLTDAEIDVYNDILDSIAQLKLTINNRKKKEIEEATEAERKTKELIEKRAALDQEAKNISREINDLLNL